MVAVTTAANTYGVRKEGITDDLAEGLVNETKGVGMWMKSPK